LNALLILFLNNLLPIFLAAGAGYFLSKWLEVNPRTLSQVSFYVFTPCLIFSLLLRSQLNNGDILRVALFAVLVIVLVGAIAWLAGRLFRLDRRTLVAVLITSMFMNAGNFGLPVLLFAFGESALAYGSLYFVVSAAFTTTVGVVIASMGSASFTHALGNLLKIPTLYAVLLGYLFLRTGWGLPLFLERTTGLLGNAAVPSMLILLGFQFQAVNWTGKVLPLALANSMRLLVAPLVALGLNLIFQFEGPARQASVLESAMPAAVLTTIVATEYDVEPSFVTAVVFTSTLLSPLTLTPLLAYLGG
jgi:predicted permease